MNIKALNKAIWNLKKLIERNDPTRAKAELLRLLADKEEESVSTAAMAVIQRGEK